MSKVNWTAELEGKALTCGFGEPGLYLPRAIEEIQRLRAVIDNEMPHAVTCTVQSEPHCEHCRNPEAQHFASDPDLICRDHSNRPGRTKWKPVPPKPCNCRKSTYRSVK